MLERLAGAFGYEKRESATTLALQALDASVRGTVVSESDRMALAAVETVASLWGRSLASAAVTPEASRAARALTPSLLETIARDLLSYGEFAALLEVRGSELAVVPCAVADVQSESPDPRTWRYLVDVNTPSTTRVRTINAAECIHIVIGSSSRSPWLGRSPLAAAGREISTLAGLMRNIQKESLASTGTLHRIRAHGTTEDWKRLKQLASSMNGGTGIAPMGKSSEESGGAPTDTLRFGFQPTAECREWSADLTASIYSACGLPPGLFAAGGDGTAQRESWRRYTSSTLAHLGRLVAEEFSMKFEEVVKLDFSALRGSDAQGISRGVKSLVDAGLDLQAALAIAGLER